MGLPPASTGTGRRLTRASPPGGQRKGWDTGDLLSAGVTVVGLFFDDSRGQDNFEGHH